MPVSAISIVFGAFPLQPTGPFKFEAPSKLFSKLFVTFCLARPTLPNPSKLGCHGGSTQGQHATGGQAPSTGAQLRALKGTGATTLGLGDAVKRCLEVPETSSLGTSNV